MKQYDDLKIFWTKIKSSPVTLKDIDELEKILGRLFIKIQDLEKSRNKWKDKYLELIKK